MIQETVERGGGLYKLLGIRPHGTEMCPCRCHMYDGFSASRNPQREDHGGSGDESWQAYRGAGSSAELGGSRMRIGFNIEVTLSLPLFLREVMTGKIWAVTDLNLGRGLQDGLRFDGH